MPEEKNAHFFGCAELDPWRPKRQPATHADVLPLRLDAVVHRLSTNDNAALDHALGDKFTAGALQGSEAERKKKEQKAEEQLRKKLAPLSVHQLVAKAVSSEYGVPVFRLARTEFRGPGRRDPIAARAKTVSVENAQKCRDLLKVSHLLNVKLKLLLTGNLDADREVSSTGAREAREESESRRLEIRKLKQEAKDTAEECEVNARQFERLHATISTLRKHQKATLEEGDSPLNLVVGRTSDLPEPSVFTSFAELDAAKAVAAAAAKAVAQDAGEEAEPELPPGAGSATDEQAAGSDLGGHTPWQPLRRATEPARRAAGSPGGGRSVIIKVDADNKWAVADELEERIKSAQVEASELLIQLQPGELAEQREEACRQAIIRLLVESAQAGLREGASGTSGRWSIDVCHKDSGERAGSVTLEAGCTREDWTFIEWPSQVGDQDLAQRLDRQLRRPLAGLASLRKKQRAVDTALCHGEQQQQQQGADSGVAVMPFGPFKGTPLMALDDSYVRFLALSEGYFDDHSNHPHPPPNLGGEAHMQLRDQLVALGRLRFTTTRDGRQIPTRSASSGDADYRQQIGAAVDPAVRMLPPSQPPIVPAAALRAAKAAQSPGPGQNSRGMRHELRSTTLAHRQSRRSWQAAAPWIDQAGGREGVDLDVGGAYQREAVSVKFPPERRAAVPLSSAQLQRYREDVLQQPKRHTRRRHHTRDRGGGQAAGRAKSAKGRRTWQDMFVRM